MTNTHLTRRQFTAAAAASVATAAVGLRPAEAQTFGPPELIEAAKKEGKFVYYTADFTEPEQEIIKAFNKRFPFVKVEMVRAPGGQLITRIKTEAAANKLLADVVTHSDRGLMKGIADLFQDYRPPNADAYRDDVLVAPQLWPKPRSAGRSPTIQSWRRIPRAAGWTSASRNTARRRSAR